MRCILHFALEEGKKILPIMTEECDLPFRLRRLQYIDFTTDYDVALAACIAHLKSLFADWQPPAPTPTAISSSIAGEPKSERLSDVVKRAHARNVDRLDGRRILWVDDRPRNNRYERKTLEDLGASVHLAIDTPDALLVIAEIPFDLIISDLGRPSGPHAGLELLKTLRGDGVAIPYCIYAGSNAPRHKAEAQRLGAVACTNNPHELFDVVVGSLLGRLSRGKQ
jgi:CheY-like chemotaxis protein